MSQSDIRKPLIVRVMSRIHWIVPERIFTESKLGHVVGRNCIILLSGRFPTLASEPLLGFLARSVSSYEAAGLKGAQESDYIFGCDDSEQAGLICAADSATIR